MQSISDILSSLKGFRFSAEGRQIAHELDELSKKVVDIGFQSGQTYPDGTEVVDVAAWNEFGTSTIPQRPFMRNTLDNNEGEIKQFMQQQLDGVVSGSNTAERALKNTGIYVKGLMQEEIVNGSYTPNAPSTIAKKGSSKPLIDTGMMRQSVDYQVKEGKVNS